MRRVSGSRFQSSRSPVPWILGCENKTPACIQRTRSGPLASPKKPPMSMLQNGNPERPSESPPAIWGPRLCQLALLSPPQWRG
jgi:hypothetical protein